MGWYKFKSMIINWFGDIKIYPYPMFIMFGSTSYKIKGEDTREIVDAIQPGDILLRRYNHYISGLMIPGYFTHAAIYIGDNKVVHALGDGVIEEDILTFCRCDDIGIIRCRNQEMIDYAIDFAKKQIGKEYDFDFNTENPDEFYCTELVYYAYQKPMMERTGSVVLPDQMYRMHFSNSGLFELVRKKRT